MSARISAVAAGQPSASSGRKVGLAPPPDLVAAPGYGARRLHQAYLAAWNRHVHPVITGPQFAVLSAIRAYPGADQTSLARAVTLDTSTMAEVCRRLERRGLIVRSASPRDARAKVLEVTAAGAEAFAEVTHRTRALEEALLEWCKPEQRTAVAELLNTLGEHWEAVADRDEI